MLFDQTFYLLFQKIKEYSKVNLSKTERLVFGDHLDMLIAETCVLLSLDRVAQDAGWTVVDAGDTYRRLVPHTFSSKYKNYTVGSKIYYQRGDKRLLISLGERIGELYWDHEVFDFILTDNVVDQSNLSPKFFCMAPEIFGLHKYSIRQIPDKQPQQLFNCFMGSGTNERHIVFEELVARQLLNQGHVSYHAVYPDRSHSITDRAINNYLPFKNFDADLDAAIIDSKCSLIAETNAIYPHGLLFTEKTFRSLLQPRPFISLMLPVHPAPLDYLESVGFNIHRDIINHDYQYIYDWPSKVRAAVLAIENLSELNLTLLASKALQNQQLVNQLHTKLENKYKEATDWLHSI